MLNSRALPNFESASLFWLGVLLLMLMASPSSQASPDFDFSDISGKSHRLSDYRGKWVIVNYWATWCPPCLEEVPDLVNLYDQRKEKDLMVFGVVFEFKDIKEVEHYVDDMLMSYPIVLGNERITRDVGSAAVLPTTYLYNPQGVLVKVKKGLVSKASLERWIAGGQ